MTLPASCLEIAGRIAQERHSNLSSVVSEALERGLREEEQARRSEAILHTYSQAFAGFSTSELLLLDGFVTEEHPPQKTASAKRSIGKGESRG